MLVEGFVLSTKALAGGYYQIKFQLQDWIGFNSGQFDQCVLFRLCCNQHWLNLPLLFLHDQEGEMLLQADQQQIIQEWYVGRSFKAEVVDFFPGKDEIFRQKNQSIMIVAKNNGLAPAIFLAKKLRHLSVVLFLEADQGFPFQPVPSKFVMPTVPAEVIGAMQLLEDWNLPHRLACPLGLPGCYEGSVLALAQHYLIQQNEQDFFIVALGDVEFLTASQQQWGLGIHSVLFSHFAAELTTD